MVLEIAIKSDTNFRHITSNRGLTFSCFGLYGAIQTIHFQVYDHPKEYIAAGDYNYTHYSCLQLFNCKHQSLPTQEAHYYLKSY